MRRFLTAIYCIATLSAISCSSKEYEIKWDATSLRHICGGVYARIKSVGDDFALVYSAGPTAYIRWSSDECKNWSEPKEVARAEGYNYTNCELLALKSGRLLYMWNARPQTETLPYKIMAAISDDCGKSWSEQTLYIADTSFSNGCWEPVALELPNGEIQLYFANESPYRQSDEQEITMLRSFDGGDSWSEPETVAMRKGSRDGMPVPLYLPTSKEVVMAIEDNGLRGKFKPVIVRSADGWHDGCVGGDDPRREEALKEVWQLHDTIYAGAPYLISIGDKHTLLSVQSTEGRKGHDHRFANMQVYVGDNEARNFRNGTAPMPELDADGSALWNSLCAINSHRVIAIMSVSKAPAGKNGIWVVEGELTEVEKY
ncbi:MAG: exo-alpha-sialidase [Alistipes sp.]|nr:exo-alpha-sialidase [Alistipes sp.]